MTEELKAKDQMAWVQQMNNIRQAAGRNRDEGADLQLTDRNRHRKRKGRNRLQRYSNGGRTTDIFEELAGEKSPAFSMPQEIIDHALQASSIL